MGRGGRVTPGTPADSLREGCLCSCRTLGDLTTHFFSLIHRRHNGKPPGSPSIAHILIKPRKRDEAVKRPHQKQLFLGQRGWVQAGVGGRLFYPFGLPGGTAGLVPFNLGLTANWLLELKNQY